MLSGRCADISAARAPTLLLFLTIPLRLLALQCAAGAQFEISGHATSKFRFAGLRGTYADIPTRGIRLLSPWPRVLRVFGLLLPLVFTVGFHRWIFYRWCVVARLRPRCHWRANCGGETPGPMLVRLMLCCGCAESEPAVCGCREKDSTPRGRIFCCCFSNFLKVARGSGGMVGGV